MKKTPQELAKANYHAKRIINKLLYRPFIESDEDGFYDIEKDRLLMIEVVEEYLIKNLIRKQKETK